MQLIALFLLLGKEEKSLFWQLLLFHVKKFAATEISITNLLKSRSSDTSYPHFSRDKILLFLITIMALIFCTLKLENRIIIL